MSAGWMFPTRFGAPAKRALPEGGSVSYSYTTSYPVSPRPSVRSESPFPTQYSVAVAKPGHDCSRSRRHSFGWCTKEMAAQATSR